MSFNEPLCALVRPDFPSTTVSPLSTSTLVKRRIRSILASSLLQLSWMGACRVSHLLMPLHQLKTTTTGHGFFDYFWSLLRTLMTHVFHWFLTSRRDCFLLCGRYFQESCMATVPFIFGAMWKPAMESQLLNFFGGVFMRTQNPSKLSSSFFSMLSLELCCDMFLVGDVLSSVLKVGGNLEVHGDRECWRASCYDVHQKHRQHCMRGMFSPFPALGKSLAILWSKPIPNCWQFRNLLLSSYWSSYGLPSG